MQEPAPVAQETAAPAAAAAAATPAAKPAAAAAASSPVMNSTGEWEEALDIPASELLKQRLENPSIWDRIRQD